MESQCMNKSLVNFLKKILNESEGNSGKFSWKNISKEFQKNPVEKSDGIPGKMFDQSLEEFLKQFLGEFQKIPEKST